MADLIQTIEAWAVSLETLIEDLLSGLDKRLKTAERELFRLILADVLPKFSAPDGILTASARNLARLSLIDDVVAQFERDAARNLALRFADELLEVAGKNAEYYLKTGFDRAKVQAIAADTSLIRAKIGLDEAGGLVADGYLARLAKSEALRDRLRDFVVESFATKQTLADFTRGMKNLIEGSSETEGALRNYWRQYAYDSYNAVREVSNLHYANELGLEWFVYTGGVIQTTRRFCEKRNRKVFSRKEAEGWVNDPDLIDKATKNQYKPLIDRGRYNCRHFIMWISETEAQRLRPDIAE